LSDDFNRANSTSLGANWNERSGDFEINANLLRNVSTSGDTVASYCGAYSNVAVSAQVQHASSGNGTTTLGTRWGGYSSGVPSQGYNVDVSSGGLVTLFRINDWSSLGSYTISGFSVGTWYTLTLRANGSTISVDVNGVTRITATDASFSSGDVGVWSYDAGSAGRHRFDNFSLELLGGGQASKAGRADQASSAARLNGRLSMGTRRALALETPPANQTWKVYYYAGAQLVAMRVMTSTASTLYFLHSDHLGSTSLTTDVNGNVLARQSYYPYGSVRAAQGQLPTDITFTGQRADATGLMYYRARYFSSSLGRFVSADTIVPRAGNPQNLNRYAYVSNSPLNYTDPSGHLLCSEIAWEDCTNTQGEIDYTLAKRNSKYLTEWGKKMLALFHAYQDTPGWWHGGDGDFTLQEFLGLTLYLELADMPFTEQVTGYLTEAVARKMYWWGKETGSKNILATTLNYIGTRAVTRDRFDFVGNGNKLAEHTILHPAYHYAETQQMASDTLHPVNSDWASGRVGYDVPWDWGNLSMFPEASAKEMLKLPAAEYGLAVSSVVYLYGHNSPQPLQNAFVIVTCNQEKYWKGK
jgi:RHS repeat-associated protein